ncbi:MAG: glycosyltransferase [Anaerolineaceae bacterium]|nr:glycosyltransferase [Anaerolineaceae bacterium]
MRLVIGHPRIGSGGSESTLMWLIEALKRDFEVTVITTGGWDLGRLNNYYGTQVRANEVKVRIAPVPFPMRRLNAAALRSACYQRYARQIAAEFDVRVSAYNMTDWGLPAVHFIADFSWNSDIRDRLHPPSPGFIYRQSLLRRAYLKMASVYFRPSGRNVLHEDLIIANSRWSAALLKRDCDVDCAAVIYPPVSAEFPHVPWEEKESSFAMIGRIAPEKQIERAITILEAVRQRGHDVRIRLCGHIGNDLYGRRIAKLSHQHKGWITTEGLVTGENKAQILARCRLGIQTCGAEAFGISVAEMAKAGAIVFASNDGGQTEILGSADLLFTGIDDAVNKICVVLESTEKQAALCAHLAQRTKMFGAEKFIEASIAVIASSLTHESRDNKAEIDLLGSLI